MTIKAIREEIARQRKAFPTLSSFLNEIEYTVETLWKDGNVQNFSRDILRMANGFMITGCEGFCINQTLDLHRITADKKATKLFAEYMLTC